MTFLEDPDRRDTDPLRADDEDRAAHEIALWEEGYAVGREIRRIKLLLFGLVIAFAAFGAARATAGEPEAPRAGQLVEAAANAGGAEPTPVGRVGASLASPAADLTPSPAGEISAIEAGDATWYDDGPGLYAAVPSWRFGDRPYDVRVCLQSDHRTCVDVEVRDFCGCPGDRIIDLSPRAFARLAPLWAGVVPVTVEDLGSRPTLPATGTEP
jgi:Lytic transglycolase